MSDGTLLQENDRVPSLGRGRENEMEKKGLEDAILMLLLFPMAPTLALLARLGPKLHTGAAGRNNVEAGGECSRRCVCSEISLRYFSGRLCQSTTSERGFSYLAARLQEWRLDDGGCRYGQVIGGAIGGGMRGKGDGDGCYRILQVYSSCRWTIRFDMCEEWHISTEVSDKESFAGGGPSPPFPPLSRP